MKRNGTASTDPAFAPSISLDLPVIGSEHPLRRAYRSLLYTALLTAALSHLVLFALFAYALREEAASPRTVRIVIVPGLPPPPPIRPIDIQDETLIRDSPEFRAGLGVPDPVKDWEAIVRTIMPGDQSGNLVPSLDPGYGTGGLGDSLVVQLPDARRGPSPPPDDFHAVEERPVLISLSAPVYPDIARSAGIEGLVLVRALVAEDGQVHEAIVVEGSEMLEDAAVDAVRRAVFRPALQQHRPVAVWVEVPLRFTLD
ncbi:MAG: energy transducer TonB [Candidatus Eisenbacteria bacterium]|nr:energy transducer TonB [Candidatus Eisenbacteria bacterium]